MHPVLIIFSLTLAELFELHFNVIKKHKMRKYNHSRLLRKKVSSWVLESCSWFSISIRATSTLRRKTHALKLKQQTEGTNLSTVDSRVLSRARKDRHGDKLDQLCHRGERLGNSWKWGQDELFNLLDDSGLIFVSWHCAMCRFIYLFNKDYLCRVGKEIHVQRCPGSTSAAQSLVWLQNHSCSSWWALPEQTWRYETKTLVWKKLWTKTENLHISNHQNYCSGICAPQYGPWIPDKRASVSI